MTVDINTILSGLTVVVLAILALLQAGAKRGLERSAELFVNNANWSRELAQQLERARGLGRQEARLDSYGALWKELPDRVLGYGATGAGADIAGRAQVECDLVFGQEENEVGVVGGAGAVSNALGLQLA